MTGFARLFARYYLRLALLLVAVFGAVSFGGSVLFREHDISAEIAWTSQRAAARMSEELARGVPFRTAAARIVADYTHPPVTIGVYGRDGSLVAGNVAAPTLPGAYSNVMQTTAAGGTVVVSVDRAHLVHDARIYFAVLVPTLALTVALCYVLAGALARRAVRPLDALRGRLLQLAAGEAAPAPVETWGSAREIAEVGQAYNAAAETIRRARDVEAHGEERMRRFVADAGHELRTPLTVIMAYAEILGGSAAGDPTAAQAVAAIRDEGARMRALVDKLILLARLETPVAPAPTRPVNLTLLAEQLRDGLRPLAGERLRVRATADHLVDGDEDELRDALGAIVENALVYAPKGPVEIALDREGENGGTIVVTVRDRGPGFAPDETERVFQRFYRGRDHGRAPDGSGLGLAIARRAVERAGGTIAARTRPEGGAAVELRLTALGAAID
ncbi:MAG TPA: HAMP domain-containing sensor histidine kinase [Candidatus Sulfotelmatobacter sp.]|nr:HAMP domain-containing sensor histidine kinase [Candidatus Sulfotelmatobacter sp.]